MLLQIFFSISLYLMTAYYLFNNWKDRDFCFIVYNNIMCCMRIWHYNKIHWTIAIKINKCNEQKPNLLPAKWNCAVFGLLLKNKFLSMFICRNEHFIVIKAINSISSSWAHSLFQQIARLLGFFWTKNFPNVKVFV